jgi:predicted nucleic-acid-binding protein
VIGLDTNVLVRYLTQDDDAQFREASALLLGLEKAQQAAYLSTMTLCETVWVLARAYSITRVNIVGLLQQLLETRLFVIDDKDAVREAVALYRDGQGDFADYLIGVRARNAGCTIVATFDAALHVHPTFFSSPATALRKSRPTARDRVGRRPGDGPGRKH